MFWKKEIPVAIKKYEAVLNKKLRWLTRTIKITTFYGTMWKMFLLFRERRCYAWEWCMY